MTLSYLNTRIHANGKPIKHYNDEKGLTWIEARDGSTYEIELKNNSFNRVLAVISVDGINVINGKEAKAEPEDGYIINGHSSIKIKGWRISNDDVKEFVFNFDKNKSYAVKLGASKKNLGVIGVAFFEEQISWTTTYTNTLNFPKWTEHQTGDIKWGTGDNTGAPYYTVSNNTYSSSDSSASYVLRSQGFDVGTAKGDVVHDSITESYFNNPIFIGFQEIYYDSYANLKKRGIVPEKTDGMPKPFKASRFCPDI